MTFRFSIHFDLHINTDYVIVFMEILCILLVKEWGFPLFILWLRLKLCINVFKMELLYIFQLPPCYYSRVFLHYYGNTMYITGKRVGLPTLYSLAEAKIVYQCV